MKRLDNVVESMIIIVDGAGCSVVYSCGYQIVINEICLMSDGNSIENSCNKTGQLQSILQLNKAMLA